MYLTVLLFFAILACWHVGMLAFLSAAADAGRHAAKIGASATAAVGRIAASALVSIQKNKHFQLAKKKTVESVSGPACKSTVVAAQRCAIVIFVLDFFGSVETWRCVCLFLLFAFLCVCLVVVFLCQSSIYIFSHWSVQSLSARWLQVVGKQVSNDFVVGCCCCFFLSESDKHTHPHLTK